MINVTLPDEKQNYVHRIGRVGRAERSEFPTSILKRLKFQICNKVFLVNLQDGAGHLFGCYGEGEGEVDGLERSDE